MFSALVTETDWELVAAVFVNDHTRERPPPEIDQAQEPSSPLSPGKLAAQQILKIPSVCEIREGARP